MDCSLPGVPYLLGVGAVLALFALCKLYRWSEAGTDFAP